MKERHQGELFKRRKLLMRFQLVQRDRLQPILMINVSVKNGRYPKDCVRIVLVINRPQGGDKACGYTCQYKFLSSASRKSSKNHVLSYAGTRKRGRKMASARYVPSIISPSPSNAARSLAFSARMALVNRPSFVSSRRCSFQTRVMYPSLATMLKKTSA